MSRANNRIEATAEKFFFEESLSTAEKLTLRAILDASLKTEVKSASFTAVDGGDYTVTGTATVTDPTPSAGARFAVFVRNGTATVGGTAYSTAGTTVIRTYHSGSWSNTVYRNYTPIASADITTALQGAEADPTRIGAEYLPEEIEINAVTLANTGAVTLPAGSLGLNTNGELILHNNVANGNKMESFLRSNSRQEVGEIFIGNFFRANYVRPLATFIVPASQAVTNKILLVSGTLWVYNGLTTGTLPTLYLGFAPTGTTNIEAITSLEMPAASLVNGFIKLDFMLPIQLLSDGTCMSSWVGCAGVCTPISATSETTTVSKSAFNQNQFIPAGALIETMGITSSFDVSLIGVDGGPTLVGVYRALGNISLSFV